MPFNRSLAATVASLQEPVVLKDFDPRTLGPVDLIPMESGRHSILAVQLPVGGGMVVVLELFDKPPPGFDDADRRLVAAAADVGADLIRQAVAERQTHRMLFDAVESALQRRPGSRRPWNQPLRLTPLPRRPSCNGYARGWGPIRTRW